MQFKTKNYEIQIRSPIVEGDGSTIFDVTLTTDEPDRDGEIVNPLGVKGLETAVVAYNHKKCDGIPVSTGAEILPDSVVQTEKELRVQVRVKPSDEMFFCDTAGRKQSNGKLLTAIQNRQIKNVSIGFNFSPSDVTEKTINGKTYTYYKTVILSELSLLDVISSNINSIIHKTMNTVEQKKEKCLSCVIEAGVGSVVVNKEGNYLKVTQISDEGVVKAKDFEGNELELDESYEPAWIDDSEGQPSQPLAEENDFKKTSDGEKGCVSCRTGRKPALLENKSPDSPLQSIPSKEEVGDSIKLETLLELEMDNNKMLQKIIEMLSGLLEKTQTSQAGLEEMGKSIVSQLETSIKSHAVEKFAPQATDQTAKIKNFTHKL